MSSSQIRKNKEKMSLVFLHLNAGKENSLLFFKLLFN